MGDMTNFVSRNQEKHINMEKGDGTTGAEQSPEERSPLIR